MASQSFELASWSIYWKSNGGANSKKSLIGSKFGVRDGHTFVDGSILATRMPWSIKCGAWAGRSRLHKSRLRACKVDSKIAVYLKCYHSRVWWGYKNEMAWITKHIGAWPGRHVRESAMIEIVDLRRIPGIRVLCLGCKMQRPWRSQKSWPWRRQRSSVWVMLRWSAVSGSLTRSFLRKVYHFSTRNSLGDHKIFWCPLGL